MSLRKGSSELIAEASDPPIGVRTSRVHLDLPRGRTNIPPGEVRWLHVSRRCGRGCGSSTGRLAHSPHSMRVVEACSAAAAREAAFVRPHCAPRITKVHSAAAYAAPDAAPVCRINWTRRHGTFPSCCLRRKLRGPFSYMAGDAASYAWRRSDKTVPGHAERGIAGAGKEIQERDLLRLRRHNV